MHIISRRRLLEFSRDHHDACNSLDAWYRAAAQARWKSIRDVHQVYPSADAVAVDSGGVVTVFNIGGNKYRLLAAIHYNRGELFALMILTHKEYDTDQWKARL